MVKLITLCCSFSVLCHWNVADLVGMSNAILSLILYKFAMNMQVGSTDNRCVPNLKTFLPLTCVDSLLTSLMPDGSGILTFTLNRLKISFYISCEALFQLLKTSVLITNNPSSTLYVQIFNLFAGHNHLCS